MPTARHTGLSDPSRRPARFLLAGLLAAGATALVLAPAPAHAQDKAKLQKAFAQQVYAAAKADVHNDRPQPLLRAVVVLRVKLNEEGRWTGEVFRDNPTQPELTKKALDSVAALPPPTGLSPEAVEALRNDGLIEAWLFQTDGRYALKTLAKAQR
jgi:hypothetical protein